VLSCSSNNQKQQTDNKSPGSLRSALIAASTANFPVTINFDLPADSTILLVTTGGNDNLPVLTNINLTVNGTLPDGSRVTIGFNMGDANSEYPIFRLTGTTNTAFVNVVFRATYFELLVGSPSLSFDNCELYGLPQLTAAVSGILLEAGKVLMRNSAVRGFIRMDYGGVFHVPSGSTNPTIDLADCVFEDNMAGYGGVFFAGPPLVLKVIRTSFVNNRAVGEGGAVWLSQASSVTFEDSAFISNSAFDGGALWLNQLSSQFTLLRCRFASNIAIGNEDLGYGGAIFNKGHDAQQSLIKQCVFEDNAASVLGGGIYFTDARQPVTITECLFFRNTASNGVGGAVFVLASAQTQPHIIAHTTFEQNSAIQGGGITVLGLGAIIVAHTTFFNNSASNGLSLYSLIGGSDAAVIDVYNSVLVGDPAVNPNPKKRQILGTISSTPSGPGYYLQNCFLANNDTSLVPAGTLRADNAFLGPLVAVDSSKPWTASRLPLQDSPLVDAAGALPAALDNVGSVDQRGNTLVVGAAADIGAVEQGECVALIARVSWLLALRYSTHADREGRERIGLHAVWSVHSAVGALGWLACFSHLS